MIKKICNCSTGEIEAIELTQEEIEVMQQTDEEILNRVRIERNRLLVESDWTQLSDSPLIEEKKLAWQAYRDSLRDLPETYLENPTYPTKPE